MQLRGCRFVVLMVAMGFYVLVVVAAWTFELTRKLIYELSESWVVSSDWRDYYNKQRLHRPQAC